MLRIARFLNMLLLAVLLAACGSASAGSAPVGTVVTPLYQKDLSQTAVAGKSPVAGISGKLDDSWLQSSFNGSVVAENHNVGGIYFTSQATATLLTAATNVVASTTFSGGETSGVKLSDTVPVGWRVRVVSQISDDIPLLVYPPTGETVDGTTNAVVMPGTWTEITRVSSTLWVSSQTASYIGPGLDNQNAWFSVRNLLGRNILLAQSVDGLGLDGITSRSNANSNAAAYFGMASSTLGAVQIYSLHSGTDIPGTLALNPIGGHVLIGASTDNPAGAVLQVNGAAQISFTDVAVAPASSTAACTKGELRVTSAYVYFCPAANTWVRSPLTTW